MTLAAATLAATTMMANAADIYVPPPVQPVAPITPFVPTDWSGLYMGAFGAYNFGDVSDNSGDSINVNGFALGGFAGYNFQSGNFVYGIEGDIGYSFADGADFGSTVDQGFISSLRGRIGYAFDSVLIYAAAGGAATSIEVTDPPFSETNTHFGWTVGAGADILFTQNVFGRIEYRYTDYGSQNYDIFGGLPLDYDEHSVRAGFGIKF